MTLGSRRKSIPLLLLALLTVATNAHDDFDAVLNLPPYWDRMLSDRGECTPTHKADCVPAGTRISMDDCHKKGCCWDPHGDNWCSGAAKKCTSKADCSNHGDCQADGTCKCDSGYDGADCSGWDPQQIEVVHVIQSCHLDAGFTSFAADVINEYWGELRRNN